MRKIFKTFVFTLMFAMASLGFNIAHAEDVWVYGNSEYSVYAITETYNRLPSPANFKINAKVVYKNGEYTTNSYLFSREGYGGKGAISTWYCIVNDSDRYLLV